MGVSASGRDSIIRELTKTEKYFDVVTDTTRAPRINNGVKEQNGVEYFFITEEEMLSGLERGEYVAPAIIHNQQVSAVSMRELKRAQSDQKTAVIDVQTDGVEAILRDKPDAQCIFVVPPSFHEWMRRLEARGELSNHELKRRLLSAQHELTHIDKSHYTIIVNDTLSDTVAHVRTLVEEQGQNSSDHDIEQIVHDLQDKIAHKLTTL